jgi:multicomponent Na+:H+ antiporter subunit C
MLDTTHLQYWLTALLLLIGIYGVLVPANFIRKLMGMNIMQAAVITFFIALAAKLGASLPVVQYGEPALAEQYINPLPHALMLTAIVVSVSTTGVALALVIRIHKRFGTLDEREIIDLLRR